MANPFDQFDAPAASGGNPFDQFDEKPMPKEPGLARGAADTALAGATGLVSGVQMLSNVAGADNPVSRGLGKANEFLADLESPYRKAEKQDRARKIKAAEESGSTWEEVKAYGGAFAEAPLDTTLNALGSSVPTLAAAFMTGGASVPAQVAARALPAVIGAAQGAGAVKGQIYEAVEQEYLKAGKSPEEAAARAAEAQAYDGKNTGQIALGTGLGIAAGTSGAEAAARRFVGGKVAKDAAMGIGKAAGLGVLKETPVEMLQGGQERVASNLALQNEGFDTPTWQGVAGQAALEGLASAPMGAGFGMLDARGLPTVNPNTAVEPPAQPPAPAGEQPPAPFVNPASLTGNDAAAMLGGQSAGLTGAADPLRAAIKPSEAMGIDPNAGAISRVAAEAVDGPASMEMAVRQAERDMAALAAEDNPEAGADPLTAAPDPLISQVAGYVAEMGTASPQMVAAKFGVTIPRATELLALAEPTVDDLFPPPQGAANVSNTDAAGALAAGAGGRVGVDAAGGGSDAGLLEPDAGQRPAGTAGAPAPSVQESDAAPVPGRDSDKALTKGPTQTKAKVGGLKELIARNKAAKANVQDQPQATAPAAAPAPAPAVQAPQTVGGDGAAQPGAAPAGRAGVEADGVVPVSTDATGKQASWVIRNKDTREVVMETSDRARVQALNTAKYEAVPVQEYLASLNKTPEPATTPEPTNGTQTSEAIPQETGREEAALLSDSVKPAADPIVPIKTVYGDTVNVRQSDLDGDRKTIPTFTKEGKRKIGSVVARDNLDPTGEKQAAQSAEDANSPMFDVITRKGGGFFATRLAATVEQRKRGLTDTHEVVEASTLGATDKGFVVKRKSAESSRLKRDLSEPAPPAEPAAAPTVAKKLFTDPRTGMPVVVSNKATADAFARSRQLAGKATVRKATTEELADERNAFAGYNAGEARRIGYVLEMVDAPASPAVAEPAPSQQAQVPAEPAAAPAPTLQPTVAQATHQDPGEKPEAATKGVVTDTLKTAAKNEDTKPSEMRKWLLAEIDKELLQAPDRADYDEAVKRMGEKDAISMYTGNGFLGKAQETGFITFDVPGDGKFKVRNSVRGLLEFRKTVNSSLGFKDGGQKTLKPEQNDGVQGGSGGQMAAVTNMIEEGDFEAARDFAEAVGIKLEDVKVPRGDMKPAWEKYLKDGTLPPAAWMPSKEWQFPDIGASSFVPDSEKRTATLTRVADGSTYVATVKGNLEGTSAKYAITKDGKEIGRTTSRQPFSETLRMAEDAMPEANDKPAPSKAKDTGWNMSGTGYGGKRYTGRNITLDDGRQVVARIYENAGNYDEVEVKVDGARKFTVRDSFNPQDKADAFIRTLTSTGGDAALPAAEPKARPAARVTPQISGNPEKFIKVAADSVRELRSVDVDRVLTETPVQFRAEVAGYIKDRRQDLADEVDDVMADLQPRVDAPAAQPVIPEGYKPAGEPFYRDGELTQGYAPFDLGQRVTMKESGGQSGVIDLFTSPDKNGVFEGAMVKFDNGVEQIVKLNKLEAEAKPSESERRRAAVSDADRKLAETVSFYGLQGKSDFGKALLRLLEGSSSSRSLGRFPTKGKVSEPQRKKAQSLAEAGKLPVATAVILDKQGVPIAGVYLQLPFADPRINDFWNRRVLEDIGAVGEVVYPAGAWTSQSASTATEPALASASSTASSPAVSPATRTSDAKSATGSGSQSQQNKLTAEDLANQDKALLDGVISVQDYMDATGLTDEDVGVAAGDGLRQQADREAKAADPYHQGIQKMQEALSDQMRVALDAPSSTPPQRKSKEERMGRITRDRATLDMIARGFEHPFDNRYVTKLSPMLKARFNKQWESIKTGEFAKQAFQEASYKLWAQKVIDKAREKLGMAAEPAAPAPEAPKKGLAGARAKKAAEAEAQRAAYFTPGNVVKGYGGHDRVLEYTPVDERGTWSVRVQAVVKQGEQWADAPRERPRWHSTQPEPKELAAGPLVSAPGAAEPEQDAKAAPATPIADAGEKIGGARKDRWKDRGLNLSDLDAMSESEGAELATKANVWKPDWEALAAQSDPVTAATVKVIFDRLAAAPEKNTPDGRRQFVEMMQAVRKVYGALTSAEELRTAKQRMLYGELQWTEGSAGDNAWAARNATGVNDLGAHMKAAKAKLFSVYKGRSDPFVLGFNELQRVKKMVADGFPAKAEPWKARLVVGRLQGGPGTTERGFELYIKDSAELGTPLTRDQIAAGFYRVLDKKNNVVAFAPTKEDAEAAAKTIYERDMKGGKDSKPEPERPYLDELKREGLPQRIDRDVTSDDFIKDLGFRGIEFGNWAAQDERQRILNMAYDGLMDLAQIMGVPPKAMSLNGTLGMAFGARGGGRFAAHYEPGKLVINMTKLRGSGSMAHEFAHALDHYFGELNKPDAYTTQARGASGWYTEDQYRGIPRKRMEQIEGKWKSVEKMRLDNLRPEMAKAFDDVMLALFQKQVNKAEMVRSSELELERTQASALTEKDPELKAMYERMAQNQKQALEELRKDPEDTMYANRGRSEFANQAQALSGKATNGYWTRPTEMFARAFESWVFDRVAGMGARSDYLVHGVEEDRFAGGGYKGNPYPTGEERASINAAFDKLTQTIKTKQDDAGNVAMFSQGLLSPASLGPKPTPDQIQRLVDKMQQVAKNALPVTVTASPSDIPGLKVPAGAKPTGALIGGRIYLFADNLKSTGDAYVTLFHELFHLGLQKVIPAEDYAAMLAKFSKNLLVQRFVREWKASPEGVEKAGAMPAAAYDALAAEEALAMVSEELAANNGIGTNGAPGLVKAMLSWLSSVADRLGFPPSFSDWVRGLTRTDAEKFVSDMVRAAMGGEKNLGATRAKYGTELAELTEQSRLSAGAANQTDTPAFKRWFGDSKVVDADGKPLVVYHGTQSDFSAFSEEYMGAGADALSNMGDFGDGFYFTKSASDASGYAGAGQGANVMPVYLSVKNPIDADRLMEIEGVAGMMQDPYPGESLRKLLEPLGYDGIIVKGGEEIVAFRPEQVKSAIGNNGQFDAGNPDIRFRSSPRELAGMAADQLNTALKSVTITSIKQAAGYKATDLMGIALGGLGRRQLVEIYGKDLPLDKYNELATQMEADKNEYGAEADSIATEWGKLKDEGALANIMHDATLAKIDPDKPLQPGDDPAAYNALKMRFGLMSKEAKETYRKARDGYKRHHANVREAIKERIERSQMSPERRAALVERMDSEFFAAMKGVYFPLARFGKYVVVVRGADGKVETVARSETMAEAAALRRNLLAGFPASKGYQVDKVILSREFVASRDAVGRGFMQELYQVLDKQDMDPAMRAEMEDTLGQLYLSSLPDVSWAKHGIHRKGTPGFSQDARRAFAQNMFHGARYLAKLRYSDLMQTELKAMQDHVDKIGNVLPDEDGFNGPRMQRVVDEFYKRHDSLMNPNSHPLSTALTSIGFMFHLGLSPASALVNLTQTAFVAYPLMAAKWGFGKAGVALLKASKQAAMGRNDITKFLNRDERRAYDEAVRAGTIDVTMAHDLAGIAQGEDAGVMWRIRPAMRAASFLFHHAERFNRQATFVAAYRLAREAGAAHEAAFEQATKATYDGHFDYSSGNRPRFMQGNAAKVILLFKSYAQNMVYTLARNAYQSVNGLDHKERAEARKALAGILATHAMAAGVLGLPMVTTILAAISAAGSDDDEPFDAQVALQNMLADTFGQKPAEVITRGLSRLGPWDISGRVGLDRLIFPDIQEGLEGQRLAESAAFAALGPVAGIGLNILKGIQEIGDGHMLRGITTMMPAALRGPLNAARLAEEGAQDKTGIPIVDEVDAASVFGQALGFSPSVVRQATEGKRAVLSYDRALNERRQELMTQYARGAMKQDAGAMQEARDAIQAFNEKNPGRRITMMQLNQSVRNRERRINQADDGVYLPKNRREAMDQGRFALVE